jgi:hypothetical protein
MAGVGFCARMPHDINAMYDWRAALDTQTKNTAAYMETGDASHITGKPFFHVPYPNSARLASLLADPDIAGMLPVTVRRPLPWLPRTSEEGARLEALRWPRVFLVMPPPLTPAFDIQARSDDQALTVRVDPRRPRGAWAVAVPASGPTLTMEVAPGEDEWLAQSHPREASRLSAAAQWLQARIRSRFPTLRGDLAAEAKQ